MSETTYREELGRLAGSLAHANREQALTPDLSEGSTPRQVKLFVDGNFDKRYDKLLRQLEFVAEAFDEFEDLVAEYVREEPAAAYDTGTSDGDRLLAWLERQHPLSPEQADYVACQRARHAVEQLARRKRSKHVAFQQLLRSPKMHSTGGEPSGERTVHLNPIRVWTRLNTAVLLDEDVLPPADLLFFALDGQSTTAHFEPAGRALLDELAGLEPCSLSSWAAVCEHAARDDLAAFCRDLVEMRLVGLD